MLKLIKRIVGIKEPEIARPVKRKPRPFKEAAFDMGDDSVLPEVVEGNSVADWELWQDSVDSQLQELTPNPPEQKGRGASDSPDPFSSAIRNRRP